ncbi:4-coumarate--CoA ligase-like 4 [Platanthera guangdongensis]|uniref:4-coumarate--CoA ligase n=1 Tax=Platanthera guangdongensis TaxID=2320717 RepID=A0ABR2MME7_9ASPA
MGIWDCDQLEFHNLLLSGGVVAETTSHPIRAPDTSVIHKVDSISFSIHLLFHRLLSPLAAACSTPIVPKYTLSASDSTSSCTHMASERREAIHPRSGFSPSTFIFHSKRKPVPVPSVPHLDVTTFISSRRHSGTVALIDASSGHRLSFSELWRAVDVLSSALSSSHAISKGDVILLLSPNSVFFPIVSLAVMSLGAILTTTNPLNTTQEISKQMADSHPVLAFTTRPLLPKLGSTSIPTVLLEESRISGEDSRVVSTIRDLISSDQGNKSRRREPVNLDDPATLLYSSGTTGASKGVVSTHRNLGYVWDSVLTPFRSKRTGGKVFGND